MNRDAEEGRNDELGDEEVSDVDVTTRVRAKELRFGSVPEVRVWFAGEPGFKASSLTERKNLPDEVEPGVTYRDVDVRWEARATIVHPTDPPRTPSDE
jgi:hypothetical protein